MILFLKRLLFAASLIVTGGIKMNPLYEQTENGIYKIILSKRMYEREAVFAAAYKFGKDFVTKIEPEEPDHVAIYIEDKERVSDSEAKVKDFLSELVDQQLRLDIANRTADIRKRIYDEAFRSLMGVKTP